MDKNNPNHIVFAADTKNNSTNFKEKATYENWKLETGPQTKETLDKFNRLINFMKDSTNSEFKNNFHKYLNLDATLNYYVMLHTASLIDNTSKNLLIATYDGEIWYPILYDLDTSWGVNWKGNELIDYTIDIDTSFNDNLLWKKLLTNFPNEIANRYFELRKEILTKNNILNKFNKFNQSIPTKTFVKEQNLWKDIPGYETSQIEEFLDVRLPLIDHKIYKLYKKKIMI